MGCVLDSVKAVKLYRLWKSTHPDRSVEGVSNDIEGPGCNIQIAMACIVLDSATPHGRTFHLSQQLVRSWKAYDHSKGNSSKRRRCGCTYHKTPLTRGILR